MSGNEKIRPLILSGGSGTRMWPLSRKAEPKQFHALIGGRTMIQETVLRVGEADGFLAPMILGNAAHRRLVDEQLAAVGVAPQAVILERQPKNTAPAIAAAALVAAEHAPDDLLLVLPADHSITDGPAFRRAIRAGAEFAAAGRIMTFGVTPTAPETGYGYIRFGAPLGDGAWEIAKFEEKPRRERAEAFLASGDYVWNAGIFMFRADAMVREMTEHCPAILEAARRAVAKADRDGTSIHLDANEFGASPEDSIDYAVMERTQRGGVAALSVGWSDVGSWSALGDILDKDGEGCSSAGPDPVLIGCKDLLAVSDGPRIAAVGVEGLIIVATEKGVLVARREDAQRVKEVVAALKAGGNSENL